MRQIEPAKLRKCLSTLGGALAALALSACATQTGEKTKVVGPNGQVVTVRKAEVAEHPTKPFRAISLAPSIEEKVENKPVKLIELTKSQQIALLVHNGTLVEGTDGLLFFVRSRTQLSSPSSLFEDAVTLANLRQRLKDVKDLPDCVSNTATVRDATAFLRLEEDIPVTSGANAIEAALKAKGVVAVKARILTPVRL